MVAGAAVVAVAAGVEPGVELGVVVSPPADGSGGCDTSSMRLRPTIVTVNV